MSKIDGLDVAKELVELPEGKTSVQGVERASGSLGREVQYKLGDPALEFFALAPVYQYIRRPDGKALVDFDLTREFESSGSNIPQAEVVHFGVDVFAVGSLSTDSNVLQVYPKEVFKQFLLWTTMVLFTFKEHAWRVRHVQVSLNLGKGINGVGRVHIFVPAYGSKDSEKAKTLMVTSGTTITLTPGETY